MSALKLTQIGNSVGLILPKELLAKLGVTKGDTVYAIETEDGIRLTTSDPEFEAQMEVARVPVASTITTRSVIRSR